VNVKYIHDKNKGAIMANKKEQKTAGDTYVYVKDRQGVEYICKLKDLLRADELTEEEKARCMAPPGGA
jgi:hypothetical protein